jgi:hypothetical protein
MDSGASVTEKLVSGFGLVTTAVELFSGASKISNGIITIATCIADAKAAADKRRAAAGQIDTAETSKNTGATILNAIATIFGVEAKKGAVGVAIAVAAATALVTGIFIANTIATKK